LKSPLLFSALFACAALVRGAEPNADLPPANRAVLHAITPGNLKADLSFLASDTLQGRYTPSPGLDVAAEFIAAEFRGAGLDPGGNYGYFQTAAMVNRKEPPPTAPLILRQGTTTFTISTKSYLIFNSSKRVSVQNAPVIVFPNRDLDRLRHADLTGKAVIVAQPQFRRLSPDKIEQAYTEMIAFDQAVGASSAAVEIVVSDDLPHFMHARVFAASESSERRLPVVLVKDRELDRWLSDSLPNGPRKVSVAIPAPQEEHFVAKNVVAILPGSDPQLRDTAVLLTAHYDHIGTAATAGGAAMKKATADDQIFNGANDDGSGTVSVIEIAKALVGLNPHPKRSIVFMTFFGEELGELGSQYYGKHPVFPIEKTVADINLEQVGRTDETLDGKVKQQIDTASITGYDYSDVTKYLEEAGHEVGVKLYKNDQASDAFFKRSDNESLARQGVPAHSLCVAFEFPDYHGVGDEWQKINYENMAHIDRMVALALINMADSAQPPEWNAENPKATPFREAHEKLMSGR
jgi:hypothetical protein